MPNKSKLTKSQKVKKSLKQNSLKYKRKIFLISLIVIILLFGIGIGIYFLIKKNSQNKNSNSSSKTETTTSKTTTTKPTTTKPATTKPTTTKPTTTKPTTTKPTTTKPTTTKHTSNNYIDYKIVFNKSQENQAKDNGFAYPTSLDECNELKDVLKSDGFEIYHVDSFLDINNNSPKCSIFDGIIYLNTNNLLGDPSFLFMGLLFRRTKSKPNPEPNGDVNGEYRMVLSQKQEEQAKIDGYEYPSTENECRELFNLLESGSNKQHVIDFSSKVENYKPKCYYMTLGDVIFNPNNKNTGTPNTTIRGLLQKKKPTTTKSQPKPPSSSPNKETSLSPLAYIGIIIGALVGIFILWFIVLLIRVWLAFRE